MVADGLIFYQMAPRGPYVHTCAHVSQYGHTLAHVAPYGPMRRHVCPYCKQMDSCFIYYCIALSLCFVKTDIGQLQRSARGGAVQRIQNDGPMRDGRIAPTPVVVAHRPRSRGGVAMHCGRAGEHTAPPAKHAGV